MDALKDLRGAHLPTKPSLWPPSFLLVCAIVFSLGVIIFLTYWFIKKRSARLKPKLIREFSLLSSSYDHHQSEEKLQADVGFLLRRVLLWHKKDATLLGQELSGLKDPLGVIFSNQSALEEVIALLNQDRFKKMKTFDPEHLLLKTKELIASCRR